jgi:hypothetical protein
MVLPSSRWLRWIAIAIAVIAALALPWVLFWPGLWSWLERQWPTWWSTWIVAAVAIDAALLLLAVTGWFWRRQAWRWLINERESITWAALRARLTRKEKGAYAGPGMAGEGGEATDVDGHGRNDWPSLTTLPLPRTNIGRLGVGVLLLLALLWYASGQPDDKGIVTYPHASLINPILGGLGALFLIYAAIRQARTAAEQAKTAGDRHQAQTKADLQRRITESFSKAIEQLGSDRLEVRLGGIYALERISKESPDDYWTVMENLTAFVRERTQRTAANPEQRRTQRIEGRAFGLWEEAGRPEGRSDEFWREAEKKEPPEADIAAVLTVIKRRSAHHRALETRDEKVIDLREAFLRSADLREAHLERANLTEAHLEGADLFGAHLTGANLRGAHLAGTDLLLAHLEDVILIRAHLDGAYLVGAHLASADLFRAHLCGADLGGAERLDQAQIDAADGDAETKLPSGLTRPAHWTDPTAPRPPPWPR